MEYIHYYNSISDASDMAENSSKAKHLGDGVVRWENLTEDEYEYLKGAEEYGPFPGDHFDLR